ncbi:glycosyltransferase [Micromonospora maritima]|uniref:Glycosyltransferase n=2 Tax=Micromonospora maritima TaxID=986711 RepID=A0ABW7ZG67_9ACTN
MELVRADAELGTSGMAGPHPADGSGRRGRLLILAHCFPPSELVGARRPAALARFARAAGWDVRVLTGTPADPAGPGEDLPEELVVRAAPVFRWPGVGGPAPADPTGAGTATTDPTRFAAARATARRVARGVGREVLMVPDSDANWIPSSVRRFLRTGWRPDVIVASGPPFSGFVVAATLGRKLRVPWVADYRDLWTVGNEYWVHGQTAPRRRADHWLERRLLRSAALGVTISEPLARTLRSTFGVETHVVMNGIDRRPPGSPARATEPAATRRAAGLDVPESALLLAHTGVLYPGRRDPGPLLDALALLGDDARNMHLVLAGVDNGVARDAVARSTVADLVTTTGQVPAERSWRIQAAADVLVLLMWDDPMDAGTVPGKLFDYLRARRPILVVGHPDGVVAELVGSRNAGVVLSSAPEIAEQLRAWSAQKRRDGGVPALPESALDGLYRDDQMAGYLRLLSGVAGRHRVVTRPRTGA